MFDFVWVFFLKILLVFLLVFLCWKLLWALLDVFAKDLANRFSALDLTERQKLPWLMAAVLIVAAVIYFV